MVYIICYESKKANNDYAKFHKEIKALGNNLKLNEGVYILESDETSSSIYFALKPNIKDEDDLLVIQAGRDWFGFMPLEKLYWIQKVVG